MTPRLMGLWCIPAARARSVAVIARIGVGRVSWTHVLRWKPGSRPEPGAWARLRLIKHRCRVDESGEFMMYVGSDRVGRFDAPGPTHFRRSLGGGVAIARVPWLSALTDVAAGVGVGGGASRHALSLADQESLWALFGERARDRDRPWFLEQQPGWRRLTEARAWDPGPTDLVARQTCDDAPHDLVALVSRGLDSSRQAATARFWLVPHDGGEALRMRGVVWAYLESGGTLLTADADGRLRVCRPASGAIDHIAPWPGWRVKHEHAIDIDPTPGASPAWARAPLSARPARSSR